MASALTALANTTLGASASSVTFSSISGSYRDLLLVVNAKNTVGATGLRIQLNGDTGATNYSWILVEGNGSSAASAQSTMEAFIAGPNATADSQQIINIMDYSATDKYKAAIVRADYPAGYTDTIVERWSSTSAVTSVKLYPAANQFATGSTFALYGVSA
jgi:hypothetical protein